MTYVVKHGENDYRIHTDDGTEPLSTSWSERPTTQQITEQCSADGPGGSLLGEPNLRSVFVDALTGGIAYRDLTIADETVPWQ